eukprot:64473_1
MRQGVLKFAIIHFNYYPHDLLQIIIDEFVVHGLNTLWNETMIYKRWEVGKVVRKFKRYITTKLHSLMDWDGNAVRILYNEKAYYKGIMQQIIFDDRCVIHSSLLNVIAGYLYELYAGYLTKRELHLVIPLEHPWTKLGYNDIPFQISYGFIFHRTIGTLPDPNILPYFETWSADEFNLVTIISWHYEEDRGWDSFNDKIHLTLAQAKEDMDNALAMAFEAAEQCHIPLVLDATYQYVPQVRTNFITE